MGYCLIKIHKEAKEILKEAHNGTYEAHQLGLRL